MESVLLAPLIFITFSALLYLMFMILTYVAYNNIANSIAQDLNMRQSGYLAASTTVFPNNISTYKNVEGDTASGGILRIDQIKCLTVPGNIEGTAAIYGATYSAVEKYKNGFDIPFAELTGITVITSKPIDIGLNRKLAGTVIKVVIDFTTINFGKQGNGIFPMQAIGYGIIA